MSDYPFFIPEFVLCANSSLFWFKVANEHREFCNYLYKLSTYEDFLSMKLQILPIFFLKL